MRRSSAVGALRRGSISGIICKQRLRTKLVFVGFALTNDIGDIHENSSNHSLSSITSNEYLIPY